MMFVLDSGTRGLLAALLGLSFFAGWEICQPSRKHIEPIHRHYFVNLFFGASNTVVLYAAAGGLVAAYLAAAQALALAVLASNS